MSGALAGATPDASSSRKATASSATTTRRGKAQIRSVKFTRRILSRLGALRTQVFQRHVPPLQ